jgi:hypothetical protein
MSQTIGKVNVVVGNAVNATVSGDSNPRAVAINYGGNPTPTGVDPGTYGSSNFIPVIKVDKFGRITSVINVGAVGSGGGGGGGSLDFGTFLSPAGFVLDLGTI